MDFFHAGRIFWKRSRARSCTFFLQRNPTVSRSNRKTTLPFPPPLSLFLFLYFPPFFYLPYAPLQTIKGLHESKINIRRKTGPLCFTRLYFYRTVELATRDMNIPRTKSIVHSRYSVDRRTTTALFHRFRRFWRFDRFISTVFLMDLCLSSKHPVYPFNLAIRLSVLRFVRVTK